MIADAEVAWIVELTVRDGSLAALRDLTVEMVDASAAEPGTLAYQRFIAEDGRTLHGYERYASSEAACEHLAMFQARFAPRFLDLVERVRCSVYGPASTELRDRLGVLTPLYLTGMDGTAP